MCFVCGCLLKRLPRIWAPRVRCPYFEGVCTVIGPQISARVPERRDVGRGAAPEVLLPRLPEMREGGVVGRPSTTKCGMAVGRRDVFVPTTGRRPRPPARGRRSQPVERWPPLQTSAQPKVCPAQFGRSSSALVVCDRQVLCIRLDAKS